MPSAAGALRSLTALRSLWRPFTLALASGRQKSRSVSPPRSNSHKGSQEVASLKRQVGSEERLAQLLHQTKQLYLGKAFFVKRLIRRASFSEPEESVEHVEHEVRPRATQHPQPPHSHLSAAE